MDRRSPVHATTLFWSLAALHVFGWTLVPSLVNANLPLDVIEALAWGREWQWGYLKHPPLSAWLAEVFGWLSGGGDWGLYLASQVCVVTAFWAMWQLAQDYLEPLPAVFSVMLLEGVVYHNFTSPEFNVNVILLACWSLTILNLQRALTRGNLRYWAATGLFAGFGILSKYLMLFLLLPMFLYMVSSAKTRREFGRPGFYLAVAIFVGLTAPHWYWLVANDFVTVSYGMDRAGSEASWSGHIYYPLKFLGAQIAMLLPAAALLATLGRPRFRNPPFAGRRYLLFVGLGPVFVFVAVSALAALKLRSMWGTPLLAISGLMLVLWFAPRRETMRAGRLIAAVIVWFGFALSVYAAMTLLHPYIKDQGKRTHFAGRDLALQITSVWRDRFRSPLPVVVGDEWLGGNLGWYSVDRPSVYLDGDPAHAPWMDDQRVRESGGVLLWDGDAAAPRNIELYRKRFGELQQQPTIELKWQTGAAIPKQAVEWAIIAPEI